MPLSQCPVPTLGRSSQGLAFELASKIFLVILCQQCVFAQTFNVIHTFSGGADGANPYAGLTVDRAGNLYGTTTRGGVGYGTVFKLKHAGSGWILQTLYSFKGNQLGDGAVPESRVVFGPDGSLYGTTLQGGGTNCGSGSAGCGTVFRLTTPPSVCEAASCSWTETILYRFTSGFNGRSPLGEVVFDSAGNLYGTTFAGGGRNVGTVYKLIRTNGGWSEQIIYSFLGRNDGEGPHDGSTFDGLGNLYGTATTTVFELLPSGSGWTEDTLYQFQAIASYAGVILDGSGNLFGGTSWDFGQTGGAVYELSSSGSGWTEQTLYSFPFGTNGGAGPFASLAFDAAGNLYGTTNGDPGNGCGGYGCGTVFELTPNGNGTWSNMFLHEFSGGSDGANPISNVVFDSSGKLYGTAAFGGATGISCNPQAGNQCGVVWQITP